MAARPYVANVVKIVFSGTVGSHNWAVVLHAQWTGATPSVAALTSFATSLGALWGTDLKASYEASTILTAVTITDLTSSTGNQGLATGLPITGTASGGTAPGNAAVLTTYPSSFRYRGGHPRTYWPAPADSYVSTPSTWLAALVTVWNTWMTALQNDLTTLTSGGTNLTGQCAVSYFNETAVPTPPHLRTTPLVMPISSGAFTNSANMASQRRRIGRK